MGNPVSGAPASTATVVVNVGDVNDNSPTFFSSTYVDSILETAHSGAIALAGVRAFDADAVSCCLLPRASELT